MTRNLMVWCCIILSIIIICVIQKTADFRRRTFQPRPFILRAIFFTACIGFSIFMLCIPEDQWMRHGPSTMSTMLMLTMLLPVISFWLLLSVWPESQRNRKRRKQKKKKDVTTKL